MKINVFTAFYSICISAISLAQNVNIPDVNFKAYLVGNPLINTNSDAEIQVSEAVAFNGTLACDDLSISDMTGLEAFINIQQLFCRNNTIVSLDLSQNSAIINVYCAYNQLETLDVSQNLSLNTLQCNSNQLTSIIFGANTNLAALYCQFNELTNIDLNNLPNLSLLMIGNNPITSLDVSMNSNLYNLGLQNNAITSLNLNSNPNLWSFFCENVPITSLDLSNNPLLEYIYCYNTEISSLNLANGANELIDYLWVQNNPNLTCIQVDDASYSSTNWPNGDVSMEDPYLYDEGVSFSEDCSTAELTEIEDANLIYVYPNPASEQVNISLDRSDVIEILGTNGALVFKSENAIDHTLNIQDFDSGVYIIRTNSGAINKLIIE